SRRASPSCARTPRRGCAAPASRSPAGRTRSCSRAPPLAFGSGRYGAGESSGKMNYREPFIPGMRTMELSDLRVFRAVAQEGGAPRAPARLHRVPSNVTVRVRKLEQDLGAALFLREGKRMTLSPAGRVLLDSADRLLGLAEEARAALHDAEPQGTL